MAMGERDSEGSADITGDLDGLATRKAAEFSRRSGVTAVAITGSIGRERVLGRRMRWPGSDVDINVFHDGPDTFEDGWEGGVYWECNLRPVSMLEDALMHAEGPGAAEAWLDPAPLFGESEGVVEVFWGCQIVHDPKGMLTRLKSAIDSRMRNTSWRARRAERFTAYGHGCIAGLAYAEPLHAIVAARAIATDYAIASFWMRQGSLLMSVGRIPERLEPFGDVHRLYGEIFGLDGEAEADRLDAAIARFDDGMRRQLETDLTEMALMRANGCHDGFVRYMRQGLPRWFSPDRVVPALGLDDDLESQKERLLRDTANLLDVCRKTRRHAGD